MRLVLFQPEIAPNVGACIRIAACFEAELDVIEPCGFPIKQREINRVALDYGALVEPTFHASWDKFQASNKRKLGRLVLLTTKAPQGIHDFTFESEDLVMLGQESAGVPGDVAAACDSAVRIPLAGSARSLNMSVAGAIALAEMRRQIGYAPKKE